MSATASVLEREDAQLLPEFRGFFEHARSGRLAFPRCAACGLFHWYPMPRCPHCRSADVSWQPIEGRGELFSFTEVRHAFDKARKDRLPYIVALVTFADAPGVRFVTNIEGSELTALRIGQAVAPVFTADASGTPLVTFRVVEGADGDDRARPVS